MSGNSDFRFLFATRILRMFAYGLVAVILALYLAQVGLSDADIGLLLTLTLLGDAVISLWITTRADRAGRKRMLLLGAALMVCADPGVHCTVAGVLTAAPSTTIGTPAGFDSSVTATFGEGGTTAG